MDENSSSDFQSRKKMGTLLPLKSFTSNSSISSEGRDAVYVAAIPLRASKGPAQIFMSLTYSLNLWDFQHYMVIIKPNSSSQSQAFVFDFQPQDPENVYVALAALSGRRVPGVVQMRKLTKMPKKKCWFIGFTPFDGITRVNRFNESWETNLKIGQHDCRDYTNELIEYLTGDKQVLKHLRENTNN